MVRKLPTRLMLLLLGATFLATGCELTEVTTAQGEDVLVVESVLRPDMVQQRVLLHRTLRGSTVRGEPGARVAVRTEGGREIVFQEAPAGTCYSVNARYRRGEDSLVVEATCYRSPLSAGSWVVPGARYELDVRPRSGGRARGSTRLPARFELRGLTRARMESDGTLVCTLPPGTPLPLAWSVSGGAWAYLTEVEITGLRDVLARQGIANVPEPLELIGVSVSERDTTVIVPTEVGIFDRFSLEQDLLRAIQGGLPAGVTARITVAAADRNFINSVRGGAFNPSGNVQLSSIVGDGIGVFGSVNPRRLRVDVRAGASSNPCL